MSYLGMYTYILLKNLRLDSKGTTLRTHCGYNSWLRH